MPSFAAITNLIGSENRPAVQGPIPKNTDQMPVADAGISWQRHEMRWQKREKVGGRKDT